MSDSKYKVEGEIRYNVRLHERHARLFSRTKLISNYLTMLSGTAGFIAFTQGAPAIGGAVSALIVLLSMADQNWEYGSIAAQHVEARKAYLLLLAGKTPLSAEELQCKTDEIDARFVDLNIVESLRDVAQNDVLLEQGHPERVVEESFRQRVMRVLA